MQYLQESVYGTPKWMKKEHKTECYHKSRFSTHLMLRESVFGKKSESSFIDFLKILK